MKKITFKSVSGSQINFVDIIVSSDCKRRDWWKELLIKSCPVFFDNAVSIEIHKVERVTNENI